MKKLDKRWFLFLVLIVILASGLSYLALSQQEQTEKDESESNKAMAVALVNEDEGSILNGQELAFGEAFVQGVNNEDDHEWFVVSRGVAESGLKRGTYDMMIVIPNDFSEKALSIDSESPDQVVLNYKINATDNEQIKAEAEKTASNILNQFNRRIIDVYFASIVGNLQNAQDNIGGIIEKQAVFTNTMSSEVYNPLDNYTNQFSTIKDSTEVSKDSFQGFQEIMNNFEKELLDDAELDEDYLSSVHDVKKLKEQNNTQILEFYQTLNEFDRSLKQQEVEQELERLQLANKLINEQLQNNGGMEEIKPPVNSVMYQSNPGGNIATRATDLARYLDESLKQIRKTDESINEHLSELEESVRKSLGEQLNNAFAAKDIKLKDLLAVQNKSIKDRIEANILKLPTLDEEELDKYVLLDENNEQEISNVIKITKLFNEEQDIIYTPPLLVEDAYIVQQVNIVENHLRTNGMTMTDTVVIPENKKKGQTFKLELLEEVMDKFNVTNLTVSLPIRNEDGEKGVFRSKNNYCYGKDITEKCQPFSSGIQIDNLPANIEGEFSVSVELRLKENAPLNLLKPIEWSWELHQKDINYEDIPETAQVEASIAPLIASKRLELSDEETTTKKQGSQTEKDDEVTKDDKSNEKKEDGSESKDDEITPGDSNGEPDEDENEEESVPLEKLEPAIKRVEIKNNKIKHKIMTPLEKTDEATKQLVSNPVNTMKPYQKLVSLYETYYGFNMQKELDFIKGISNDTDMKLGDYAKDTSLFHLFEKENINGLIIQYVVNNITEGATKEIRTPWEQLQAQIEIHEEKVALMNSNAEALVNKIDETAERARVLNKSLETTLSNVEAWREKSLNLLESQEQIQTKEDEEQSAIVSLDDSFQPLLSASQSLSEQAQSNVNEGDVVYDTFDSINEQATTIQESGDDIVQQVETLSENMTNKLMDDENFAENFTGVLANSRIGDRQNEDLYDFLSNPVQTSNEGTITSSDSFTPYYLVLICFIVVLFTAYVISTINQKRMERDPFSEGKTIMSLNTPITLITIGIGVLEGIVIGVVSSYTMEIADSDMLMLTTLIVLLITGMLLFSTYLLRQVKMIGMFILLVVLSLYLFLTNALGTGIKGMETWKEFSPLQYVETLLFRVVQGEANYSASIFIMIGVVIVGALANLFVVHRSTQKGDVDNEKEAEAS
ncbi:type VII secretion protein EsaA [Virgibacillus dokdonensis]|uniref:Type VII secretion system accessory factor EsaA n=1 Tax=Virgibacillus dokdonensis TaxID=302167 RepID=A0A3E0WU08_9BACI|nr:type VII secretion protein EsaA [Virgibacillus dokdonensis]RFA35475.1 type VII secretion protein EsaA [Virgibacillus dokdonensis]